MLLECWFWFLCMVSFQIVVGCHHWRGSLMSDVPLKSKTMRNGLSITSLVVVASCRVSFIKSFIFCWVVQARVVQLTLIIGQCVLYCLGLGWSQNSTELDSPHFRARILEWKWTKRNLGRLYFSRIFLAYFSVQLFGMLHSAALWFVRSLSLPFPEYLTFTFSVVLVDVDKWFSKGWWIGDSS